MATTTRKRTAGSRSNTEAGIVRIPLDKLHDHPGNPDPEEAEIVAMMSWLQDEGQQEAITVRQLDDPIGHFQVLAGKTRSWAARRLGWPTLDARVRDDLSDDQAAHLAATNNTHRRTENPLRQAQWLKYLADAGKTVKDAAAVFGWSESYGRSMIGLLHLPEPWRGRIVSGEMPATVAVRLNPYADHPKLLKAIDRQYCRQSWTRQRMQKKEQIGAELVDIVRDVTRPVEPKDTYNYGWQLGGGHPRYFKLTPELEAQLQIVQVPIGKNGKLVRRAMNTKKYDALQKPLIKKRMEERRAGKTPKKAAADKLTPAQVKKEEERKRREAQKKLLERLEVWQHFMLRLGISEAIKTGDWRTTALLPWAMARLQHSRVELDAILAYSVDSHDVSPHWAQFYDSKLLQTVVDEVTNEVDDDPVTIAERVQADTLSYLFWPHDSSAPEHHAISQDFPWGQQLPPISNESLAAIAKLYEVTLPAMWIRGATLRTDQRELVRVFLDLHNREQLEKLAAQLLGAGGLDGCKKVADMRAKLLESHTAERPLKFPTVLNVSKKK